eukprot:TRINITY_DN17345_c0_g1_i2.p1 TRINITY_DN17345_c0_g1~~TRINITY_DN17345_c0_g1_i2.p1  ORF type:complete len:230 (-),score=17.99 TRINITY_DN17345_c0_g1_i2:174-863(-)
MTANLELPAGFHHKLSQLAIDRYLVHAKAMESRQSTPEAVNNGFFSLQQEPERWWPELLQSNEYHHLRKLLTVAAVEYAQKIGRYPVGESFRELTEPDLFLWTAVYTEGTPHLTHCHDQGIVSGVYYSQAPVGVPPIVFSDPRGGQPMHIDSAGHAPETEPEPPFHQNAVLFPNAGNLVFFPSWLPHRVPPGKSNQTRVVWAFNLNGPISSWSRSTHAVIRKDTRLGGG